jgi:hypothetical protein
VAIVSAGTTLNYATRTTVAITVPSSAAAGHIAIVDLYYEGSATTVTGVPTGFTREAACGPFNNMHLDRYWKRLTGADTGTYSFTVSANVNTMAQAILLSGRMSSGSPFDTSTGATVTGGTASGSPPALTLTATTTGVDLLFATCSLNSNPSGITGWTYSINNPDDTALFTKVNQSSGQPGSTTPTGGTDSWCEILSAVLLDTGGGPALPPELIMQTRRAY